LAQKGEPVWLNIIFLHLTPLMALVLVPWWIVTHGIGMAHIGATFALWALTGLGITVGYHRLFSHRAYRAGPLVRAGSLLLGGAAWQNSALQWSSDHRIHHRKVDTDEDPYDASKGFWWSHMGWILTKGTTWRERGNVKDLEADLLVRLQERYYFPITIAFNLGIPIALGLWVGDVWGMLIFAGLLRVVLLHHATFFINSLAHMWGRQPWSRAHSSRDNWFLSLFTFGEGYHNYHHTFETDYRNGPRWWNFDPAKWTIWSLDRVGMVSDLKRMPVDMVLKKRFEDRRGRLILWLDDVGHKVEELGDQWRRERETVASALRCQLDDTQERLEASLIDLRRARSRWLAACRQRTDKGTSLSAKEVRALKRAFRNASRSVKASLREWEALLADYMAMQGVQPQAI
jgi:stearoyl-CoA desaturase (delta-9 desaturase)